jgi:hypothetical protein
LFLPEAETIELYQEYKRQEHENNYFNYHKALLKNLEPEPKMELIKYYKEDDMINKIDVNTHVLF